MEYTYQRTAASESDAQEVPPEIGEVQTSDYIVLLFALDTYFRYVQETTGSDETEDAVASEGLKLFRFVDRAVGSTVQAFLRQGINSPPAVAFLEAAFSSAMTPDGVAKRAYKIRGLLTRGGPAVVKHVFGTTLKARRAVAEALDAVRMDDPDAALAKLSVLDLRNNRLEAWIDLASDTAVPKAPPVMSAVAEAATVATQAIPNLQAQQAIQDGTRPGSSVTQVASVAKTTALADVEAQATKAAAKVISKSGEEDRPLTRSEVIGVATAVAAASKAEPTDLSNVPRAFINGGRPLDPEQMAAALTDGRVLVAAGAGSGKSTTLISRVGFLVQDRKVPPNRILVCTFAAKAADELKTKINKKLGGEFVKTKENPGGMAVGTMHSVFYGMVRKYGNAEEKAMLAFPRLIADAKKGQKNIPPSSLSRAIMGIWKECGPESLANLTGFPVEWFKKIPKAKEVGLYLNKWRGNEITLADAKGLVRSEKEAQAYAWYILYSGLKGDLGPRWLPPCGPVKSFSGFTSKYRKTGERLGDMDDMLSVFRDILVRDPMARKEVQETYDYLHVDECQDANKLQHTILKLMSEHITDGNDGKSLWMVGDYRQAIYQFRGGDPELFAELYGQEGWKTRLIQTNYRCQPEIVEHANALISNNPQPIPMDARANPSTARGQASIRVETPADDTVAAISTIGRAREAIDNGSRPRDFAVLARTNAELNAFETACVINEIPYVRRGGRGFLEAPEARAVLGYMQLAQASSYESKKQALIDVLMKPDRGLFGLRRDDVEKIVDDTLDSVAQLQRLDVKMIDPEVLLGPKYVKSLADGLKRPMYEKMVFGPQDEWKYKKAVDSMAAQLPSILKDIKTVRMAADSGMDTEELINTILEFKASYPMWDKDKRQEVMKTMSLREQITEDVALFSDAEEGETDEEAAPEVPEVDEQGNPVVKPKNANPAAGLGAVQFLYELMKPTDVDVKSGTNPTTATGFMAKMDRFAKSAGTLKVDLFKWEAEQAQKPEGEREEKPNALTLSTVHAVKGLEWPNVSVMMPEGKFPMVPKPKKGERPPTPEEEQANMVAERNLAYVALTRAATNLEVLCPSMVGNRKAGVSPFVFEADLVAGENVKKPGMSADGTVEEEVPFESIDDTGFEEVDFTKTAEDYAVGPDDAVPSSAWKVDPPVAIPLDPWKA